MTRRRYSFDEAKIKRFLKEGRGQGRGAEYRPWLTISDVPSRGRSHRLQGLTTARAHHLLSDIECGLFYLADWAEAVTDIREQFPLERDATQRIGAQTGIAHPQDAVTRTPLVMTTDFLIDAVRNGRMTLLARAGAGYAALPCFLGFFGRICLPLSGLATIVIRPVATRV